MVIIYLKKLIIFINKFLQYENASENLQLINCRLEIHYLFFIY